MSDSAPLEFELPEAEPLAPSKARTALLKRLADVVCLPSSRVNTFERAVTADLLVQILREAGVEERVRVARRLANLSEIPASLVRLLLRDVYDVAGVLLETCAWLNDADLLDCARTAGPDHRRAIALRRGVSELVSEGLIPHMEAPVIEALLRNDQARLSYDSVDILVAESRDKPKIVPLLLKRPELRPSHAYILFWWADQGARRTILQRFSVTREVLQEAAGDVFALAAAERWSDPLSRKALQFIERRQRNRAAIDKSPFNSLDEAIAVAAEAGMTREVADEISYLSGLKPMTGAKIFADAGGEPLAILCKATGLPKSALKSLWRALDRPQVEADGSIPAIFEHVLVTFDMMAVDRAQTVLRYWNWSLSSALTPALLQAIRGGGEGLDEYSIPERAALLTLGHEFGR